MQTAVSTNVAPLSSFRRRTSSRWIFILRIGYELGLEIWRTSVDEMVEGMMTPIPGSSGKRGLEL
jgi:hypothetical protein